MSLPLTLSLLPPIASLPLAAFDPGILLVILKVAAALGFVIFVHELGHFAVAKMCGVKCEKFYLGFDIYGLKLAKFVWGETEYGIGILPLGGYVKMLGQEDNPNKAYEEMQRAKAGQASGDPNAPVYDPRSYLAQSVPKRMAIISAGVVMNLIFAFLMAALAYGIGVPVTPCVVSGLQPGSPAWQADLRIGDEITAIDGQPNPSYKDLLNAVVLGNLKQGLELSIRRPEGGDGKPLLFDTKIVPKQDEGLARIGVSAGTGIELTKKHPTRPGSPAAKFDEQLSGGKRIVAINDVKVSSYADFHRELAHNEDKPISLTVEPIPAEPTAGETAPTKPAEPITVTIEPSLARELGIVMKMGPITAVQANSPAADAGLKSGDRILLVNGEAISDPLRWPAVVRKQVGQEVRIMVGSEGGASRELAIKPRAANTYEWPTMYGENPPLSIPELGLAYAVENEVASVDPAGPAASSKLKAGDVITQVTFISPKKSVSEDDESEDLEFKTPLELAKGKFSWVFVISALQYVAPDSQLKLTLKDGTEVTLTSAPATDWYNPLRGLHLVPIEEIRQAQSVGEAFSLGWRETTDSVLMVYRFLYKLGHQVPISEVRGPITIARVAGHEASAGFARLLIFLVMLSANLAVLNFLPIPMLDGGHMLFLIIEGIRRKPVSERVFVAFQFAGILFLMSLMAFALFGDVSDLLK